MPFTSSAYPTGYFSFSSDFYVVKGAYLNFQSETITGIGWSFVAEMTTSGVINFTHWTGSSSSTLLNVNYPTNQWFELRMEIDLNLNSWGVYIDSVFQGSFTNPNNGEEKEELFDFLLAATGRSPNVNDLGLENTELELDSLGVPLYNSATMQCGNSSIFIAGDVNNDFPLLHEAADEGQIAGDNAGRFPDIKAGLRRSPVTVVFCDPQIAIVGDSWSELEGNENVVTGKVSFEGQGRSRIILKNKGLMHIYADRNSGLFLGSEFIGPHAEHLAHLMSWAHQQNMTIQQMLEMPFYHPVIEEGLRTALRDAESKLG